MLTRFQLRGAPEPGRTCGSISRASQHLELVGKRPLLNSGCYVGCALLITEASAAE
jgi:hypothetical protein